MLFGGKYTRMRAFQTLLAAGILVCTLSSMISGIVLSEHVFAFLPVRGGWEWAQPLHMLGAYWGFVLMSLHLGVHWNMVTTLVRRSAGDFPAFGSRLLRLLAWIIAAYGVYAFYRRNIGRYLLLIDHFVFFDFEEPRIFFFLDYLAIIELFVFVGNLLAKALRKP